MQSVYALDNNYPNQVNSINTQSINKGILKKFSKDTKTIKKRVRFSKIKHIRTYKENTLKEKINNNKININSPNNDPRYTPCESARFPVQGQRINSGEVGQNFQNINTTMVEGEKFQKLLFIIIKNLVYQKLTSQEKMYLHQDYNQIMEYIITIKNKYNKDGQSQNTINLPYLLTTIYYDKGFNVPNDYTKLPVQTPPINSGEVDQNCLNINTTTVDGQSQNIINTTIHYDRNFDIPNIDISEKKNVLKQDVTTTSLTVTDDEMVTSCENNNNNNNEADAPTQNTNTEVKASAKKTLINKTKTILKLNKK